MNRHDVNEIAKAIAALNLWEKASAHNWALVPQTSELPYLVTAGPENKKGSPVLGRLQLFPGFVPFRDFMLSRKIKDFGVGMSPMDFDHFELVSAKRGVTDLFVYEPGFVAAPFISPVVLSMESPFGSPFAATVGSDRDEIPSFSENALPAVAFAGDFASFFVFDANLKAFLSAALVTNFA